MPTFRYTAVNAAGNAFQEEVEDVSAKNVVERLQEQGYTVNEIVEITIAPKEPSTHLRLSWRDLDLFMQQLHMITHAKMPIASALAQLSTELETPGLKPILERVRADLEAGNTLEYALSRHPKAFPPLYLALSHAGSEGGNMAAYWKH